MSRRAKVLLAVDCVAAFVLGAAAMWLALHH
jgi:hypothetical protein